MAKRTMVKRARKRPDIKKMNEVAGRKFSITWSVVSWLISLAILIFMGINYNEAMLQGGGLLYQLLLLLIGVMVVYRFIIIVYNIIQKSKEK